MQVGKNVGAVNPLVEPRIMSALERALLEKGHEYLIQPKDAVDAILAVSPRARS